MTDGGYDDGYIGSPCLWGSEPGSLVAAYLTLGLDDKDSVVWDLGCGEGKNAAAFAKAGARVQARDCSAAAILNGQAAWPDLPIDWDVDDAASAIALVPDGSADHVVLYGLTHCLTDAEAVTALIRQAQNITKRGGNHFLVAFNDGPHDLSAHPNFFPLLLPHSFYEEKYAQWRVHHISSSVLHETHPHNNIPHFHSVTRIWAEKT